MKENAGNIFNSIVAALGVIFGFLYGELDGLLITVIVLMAVDYISGVASSFVLKTTSSKIGWIGIVKKFTMLLILAVAHILDVNVLNVGEGGAALMTLVEFLFISNEGLSIIENAGKIGIKLPKQLKNALVQLKLTSSKVTLGVDKSSDTGNSDADKETCSSEHEEK